MRARPLAIAAAIILPLLVAGCSRTYSSGREFRNGWSFAALKSDGSVVAWGSPTRGGDPECTINPGACAPAPPGSLSSGVVRLFSTYGSFAALKSDGSLVPWGGTSYGGEISCAIGGVSCHPVAASRLASGVVEAASTYSAFAATKADGSVVTWGETDFGGDAECAPGGSCRPAPAGSLASGVTKVWGTYDAFAALKADGTVVAWGDSASANTSTAVGGTLTGIVDVVPGGSSFAAIKANGAVVTWGAPGSGGDPTCAGGGFCTAAPAGSLASGVVEMNTTNSAFAARKADGSVVTWGDSFAGGNSSAAVGGALTGVTSLAATDRGFAAVKSNGSVVTWGDPDYGADPTCTPGMFCTPAPPGSLASGVVSVVASRQAFAALKSDGSVVAWGAPLFGGEPSCTPGSCTPAPPGSLASGVADLMWTGTAFIARKHDGSVVTWGSTPGGGDSSTPVGGALTGVVRVFSSNGAGAALTASGSVVAWGDPDSGGDPRCVAVPSGTCSPAPAGSLSSGVVYIASPFVAMPRPASPTPAPGPVPADAGGGSAVAPAAALGGRTTCVRRRCTTRGPVPAGTTSVTQIASSSASSSRGLRANAAASTIVRGRCSTTSTAYTCTIALAAGRWTITTRALAGATTVASSARRVTIRRITPHRSVTG